MPLSLTLPESVPCNPTALSSEGITCNPPLCKGGISSRELLLCP